MIFQLPRNFTFCGSSTRVELAETDPSMLNCFLFFHCGGIAALE